MAKRAQTSFRTGWLYRILKSGTIASGDEIRLLERKHPEWPIARVQYYLYHEMDNEEAMRALVEIEELGESIKKIFRGRLERRFEDQNLRMYGEDWLALKSWSTYKVVQKTMETSEVVSLVLKSLDKDVEDVPVEPGSHVRLKLGGKLVRAYSVVRGTARNFELGIALDAQTRGGSKFLHENTHIGDVLTVGCITASFPLAKTADHHIFIAGGIGITAFVTALSHLQSSNQSFELHFAVRDEVPFQRYIAPLGPKAKIYSKALGQRLDIAKLLRCADSNTHIYVCGPSRLMDGVTAVTTALGIPDSHVHFENFSVTTSGDPFTAELRVSKKTVEVEGKETLLEALRKVGMNVDSGCEAGNCGSCRVGVCEGRVEHRGTGLMESEKQDAMLSCVSRGVGRIVLEL